MRADQHVANIQITLYKHSYMVGDYLFIKEDILTSTISNVEQMQTWIESRLMPFNTRHYVNLINYIFRGAGTRMPSAGFIFSLLYNTSSVTDDYWLNINKDVEFEFNRYNISLKRQTWEYVKNNRFHQEARLCEKMLSDLIFVSDSNEAFLPQDSVFTTNGYKQKRWISQDNILYLEKRLTISQLNDEIKCLDFFKSQGIRTPEHKHIHIDVNDKTLYFPETIRSGIDVIRKKRLNERGEEIFPLIWFVNEDNANSLELMINYMGNILEVNKEDSDNFINAITSYLTQNEYRKIASDNLGFIRKSDGSFKPAVWSNIVIK